MKLGVIYPQIELSGNASALGRFARAAEQLGYHHLVLYDHVVGSPNDGPAQRLYDNRDPFHDPFAAFAYLAGVTTRIEFVTGILILPQRQTVLVAKQAADVDNLSNGRLRLGVGAGYDPAEFRALGANFSARGRRLNEQIPYLRRLWNEELIDFAGEFDQIDHANIAPRPQRQIPIWCGGSSEAAFSRAVRMADGFIFGYGITKAATDSWLRLQHLLSEADRPIEEFGAHFLAHPAAEPYTEQEVIDGLVRLRDAGASDASIYTAGRGFTDVEEHIEYITDMKESAVRAGVASAS